MSTPLPHEHVYARIAVSRVAGVGVVAIRNISEGTNIFANDRVELVWVDKSVLDHAGLTAAERALYDDFGIVLGDRIGCPVNFHNLTPGWYLNEPPPGEESNVGVDGDFSFHAKRDIAEGEELTVRYAEFSEGTPNA